MKKGVVLSVIVVLALLGVAAVAIILGVGKSGVEVAREATERYQRMDLVLADGFTGSSECVSDPVAGGMGVHYIQPDRLDSRLKVSEPEALVFAPQDDGRIKLVAVEYIVPAAAWSGSKPPTLLGQTLQYKTMVGPDEVDPFYALHAWVWEDNPSGVFADWNPGVACRASAASGGVSGSGVYDSADGGGTFTFSGDDAYDPAAGGMAIFLGADDRAAGGSYSGDDAYDPAAGGLGGGVDLAAGAGFEFGECVVSFLSC